MEQKKHKQIKTIRCRLDDYELFDSAVNKALADGWFLEKRYALLARTADKNHMLIAELQRYVYD